MLLTVDHVTRYCYDTPVRGVVQSHRLTPSRFDGQKVVNWTVTVSGDLAEDNPTRAAEIQASIRETILPKLQEDFGIETRQGGLVQQERDFLGDATTALIPTGIAMHLADPGIFPPYDGPGFRQTEGFRIFNEEAVKGTVRISENPAHTKIYREAAAELVAEGKFAASDFPPADDDGFRAPLTDTIDGVPYDGRKPNAYLDQFEIGLKGDTQL